MTRNDVSTKCTTNTRKQITILSYQIITKHRPPKIVGSLLRKCHGTGTSNSSFQDRR
jgi:hypothetical protein